jgi:hypothetical protein
MVLADLWITGQIVSEAEGDSFWEGDYRALLDGLRYEDVLGLAGPDSTPWYRAAARVGGSRNASGSGLAWSRTDPNRFPTYVEPPPGMVAGQ